MSKVVYLMGAGASYGKRITNEKNFMNTSDGEIDVITEGLPIVTEIPERLDFVSNKILSVRFPLDSFSEAEKLRTKLVEDLQWLKNESLRHATLDTFAKKLYLRGEVESFIKVEVLLSIFFIVEQVTHRPDGRYDTLLANILTREMLIPEDIVFLTWNYDCQFEIALKEYIEKTTYDFNSVLNTLDITDDIDRTFYRNGINHLIKLNGTANFRNNNHLYLTKYSELSSVLLTVILKRYKEHLDNERKWSLTNLTFAWDNEKYIKDKWQKIDQAIKNAEILVIIGYTFPFFNRETDRVLFKLMPNLHRIYIQDPNADNLSSNLLPVLSEDNRKVIDHTEIIPVKNVNQFYLPQEL